MIKRVRAGMSPGSCTHHWILGPPVNDFVANTVTISHRCKKCEDQMDVVTEARDARSLTIETPRAAKNTYGAEETTSALWT